MVGIDPYNGPLYQYLLAAAFQLFGISISAPRLLVLVFGVLTVVATYFLARELAGPLAGAVAALLLAFCAVHIAINSHIAWSNSLTPFFTTIACLAFITAEKRGRPRLYLVGGLLSGLALQTHPTVVALWAGVALWFLLSPIRRKLLRTPLPYIALALALLAYSNMLLYNVRNFGKPASSLGAASSRTYAYSPVTSVDEYSARLVARGTELARMLGSSFTAQADPRRYFNDPFFTLSVLLSPLGLLYSARRSSSLPLAVVASALLLFPAISRRDNFPVESRYLSMLLPMCYAGIAVLVAALISQATASSDRRQSSLYRNGTFPLAKWAVAGALLMLVSMWSLHGWFILNGYYSFVNKNGPNNVTLLRIVNDTVAENRTVWIDRALGDGYWLGAGAEVAEALAYLYRLAGHPYTLLEEQGTLQAALPGTVIILTPASYSRLASHYPLRLYDPGPPSGEVSHVLGGYAAYELTR